jgi:hypothetical protein
MRAFYGSRENAVADSRINPNATVTPLYAAPPPPSVSTDNGSRPREAVPTEQAGWPVLADRERLAFLIRASLGEYIIGQSQAYSAADFIISEGREQPADGCSSNEGADGWIAHVGTPNPAPGKHVRARFRSGAEVDGAADGFEWGHWPCDGDIIAYRILPQTEKGS